MYKSIEEKIQQAKVDGKATIVVGDMNAKIGNQIIGNHTEISKGGKLLIDMAKKQGMTIVNKKDVCKGKWTKEEAGKKSIIDYTLIDEINEQAIKK